MTDEAKVADEAAMKLIHRNGFEWSIRFGEYGEPRAITRAGYDVIHVVGSERNEACLAEFVKMLNSRK